MKKVNYAGLILLAAITLASCNNDDTISPVNEEEVITTVRTTLTHGAETITLLSRDFDGDGPNAPIITVSGTLTAGTQYDGMVTFINDTETAAESINSEILEESADHQIFFQLPNTIGTVTYSDMDENGMPLGLEFTLQTGAAAANGNLVVTLKHQPNKNANSVANGDMTNAGGSTDAQVSYPIQVVD